MSGFGGGCIVLGGDVLDPALLMVFLSFGSRH